MNEKHAPAYLRLMATPAAAVRLMKPHEPHHARKRSRHHLRVVLQRLAAWCAGSVVIALTWFSLGYLVAAVGNPLIQEILR